MLPQRMLLNRSKSVGDTCSRSVLKKLAGIDVWDWSLIVVLIIRINTPARLPTAG